MTAPLDPTAGQSAGTGTQSGTDGQTQTGQTAPAQGQSAQNDGQKPQTVTRDEHDQLRSQLSAADKRREEAERRVKALEDEKLTEAERQTKALTDTQAENAKLKDQLRSLQIDNAFMVDNTHDWRDVKAALKLADLSGVAIDDSGKVEGLKAALDAVAKAYPYLLKEKAEGGDGGDAGSGSGSGSGAGSGSTTTVTGVAGGGNGANGNDNNALLKRFPQLAGRVS